MLDNSSDTKRQPSSLEYEIVEKIAEPVDVDVDISSNDENHWIVCVKHPINCETITNFGTYKTLEEVDKKIDELQENRTGSCSTSSNSDGKYSEIDVKDKFDSRLQLFLTDVQENITIINMMNTVMEILLKYNDYSFSINLYYYDTANKSLIYVHVNLKQKESTTNSWLRFIGLQKNKNQIHLKVAKLKINFF